MLEETKAVDVGDVELAAEHSASVPEKAETVSGKTREGDETSTSTEKNVVTFCALFFKYATWKEVVLMLIGSTAAALAGVINPIFIIVFGEILDELNGGDVLDAVRPLIIMFILAGVLGFVGGTIMVLAWNAAGERLVLRIKRQYVRAILRQDMGWFDEHPSGELPGAVVAATEKIQNGISRKVADVIQNMTTFLGTFIVAFFYVPKLAATLLACFPFIALSVFMLVKLASKSGAQGSIHYSKAGGVANEVIGAVRTVASLTAEEQEIARYSGHLHEAEKAGIMAGLQEGIGLATLFSSFFLGYALAFWYGTKLVAEDLKDNCESDCITGGDIITTIFGVLIGAMTFGQATPGLQAVGSAREAAYAVFQTLDRVPEIDSSSPEGEKPSVEGQLEFKQVSFAYPARPSDEVFKSVSVSVSPGETLALVGPSGGGKSTFTKLLLRFYDPTSGSLLLDGQDFRSLNVSYLRSKIGFVGQEPVLFAGSIKENVALGKPGATDQEITKAAKAANAHEFINSFPNGYATEVGTGGMQLSGGQKQRVAIARAIIKDPAILLLDEATSALDTESEKVVQEALDRLRKISKYTTIVIAHRLSTIQDADRIAVIANKGIAEMGTHSELLHTNGIYTTLCAMQQDPNKGSNGVAKGTTTLGLRRERSMSSRSASSASVTDMNRRSSAVEGVKDELEEKTKEPAYPLPPSSRMWALNKPETGHLILGFFGAVLAGSLFPVEAILIANMQSNLYVTDAEKIIEEGEKWSLGFVALSVVAMVGHCCKSYGYGVAGERLTRRLREIAFRAILRHHIGWFDKEENSVGVLTSNLEEDAAKVKVATGTSMAETTQLSVTLLLGLLIGVISAWQIGLLAVGLLPMMGIAAYLQNQAILGESDDDDEVDGLASPGLILGSALNGIATVTAFNMQDDTASKYEKIVVSARLARRRASYSTALGYGYSQGAMMWMMGTIFYVGAVLIDDGEISFLDFFQSFFAVFLAALGLGQIQSEVGAALAARQAAGRIFRLEDDKLSIDPLSEDGAKGPSKGCAVTFRGVKFAYPQRPDAPVYGSDKSPRGFELDVGAGETVALVGPSGSGKSTCIQLLLRFYDTLQGEVLLDGRNIKELNVHWLRSQEPVLFTGTIRENIEKGKPGATMAEIEAAAKSAFAHEFITSFENGYETDVGEKSALLSGGQKQRVAIARAIISDPPILLLDEATSALDNESERQVQAALDHLQKAKRRTMLMIAHRLTTVRDADKIAVISQGGVVELGSHEELMKISQGIYAGLYHRQTEKFS